jgi:ATP-dependent Zn protease
MRLGFSLLAMTRRTPRLQRRITAYHEAAHAVLSFEFGIPVDEVAVCRTGRIAGYVQHLDVPLMEAVEAYECECTSPLEW